MVGSLANPHWQKIVPLNFRIGCLELFFSRTSPSTKNIILEMTADMGEDNKKGVCVQHVCILIQLPCVCFWVFYTVDSVYKPKSYFLFIYPINEGIGK